MHAYIHTSDHPCIFGTCTPGTQASIRTYIHTYIHYTCCPVPRPRLQCSPLQPSSDKPKPKISKTPPFRLSLIQLGGEAFREGLRFPLQLCALDPDCYIAEESAMGPDAWKHGYGAQTASYHPIVRYGNPGQRSSAMLPLCQYLYHKMATTVSIITIAVTIRSKAHPDCKPFAELRVCQPLAKPSKPLQARYRTSLEPGHQSCFTALEN